MPVVTVQTNISAAKLPIDFRQTLTQVVSEMFNKPVERVTIMLEAGKDMIKNNSADPLVLVHMECLAVFDNLSQEKNEEYSTKLLNYFNETLGLPDSRIVIVFVPLKVINVAVRPR